MTVLIYVDTEDLEVIWVSDLLARAVARVRPSNLGSRAFLRIGTELNEATRPLQHGATTPKISIWSCRTTLGKDTSRQASKLN